MLAHITAPSRASDDARYRTQAAAAVAEFETGSSFRIYGLDDGVRESERDDQVSDPADPADIRASFSAWRRLDRGQETARLTHNGQRRPDPNSRKRSNHRLITIGSLVGIQHLDKFDKPDIRHQSGSRFTLVSGGVCCLYLASVWISPGSTIKDRSRRLRHIPSNISTQASALRVVVV